MSDVYKRLKNQVFSTTGCNVNDQAISMILLWGAQQTARAQGVEGCRFCVHRDWIEDEGATLDCPYHGDGVANRQTLPEPPQ